MKKLLKILSLSALIVFTICISSYATEGDTETDPISPDTTESTPVSLEDSVSKVKLDTTSDVISSDTIFNADIISEGEKLDAIKSLLEDSKFTLYNTSAILNDEIVTPAGKLKLSFPISEDYNTENLAIYAFDVDNNKVDCTLTIESDYATIETNHFGYYAVVDLTKSSTGEPTTPPDTSDDKTDEDVKDTTIVVQDSTSNIKLEAKPGVVPNDTTLQVSSITDGEKFNSIKELLGDVNFIVFDISLISNGSKIQPTGNVKISIPIPSNYDKNNLIVYRIADDGTKIDYSVTVDGNFAVIETNHFSDYVLSEKTASTSEDTTNTNTNVENTNLDNEPKTGISNPVHFILSVLVISCLGLAICIKKMSK